MKTVLFFIESTRNSCTEQLEGIFRYARRVQWHVQLVECGGKPADVLSVWFDELASQSCVEKDE